MHAIFDRDECHVCHVQSGEVLGSFAVPIQGGEFEMKLVHLTCAEKAGYYAVDETDEDTGDEPTEIIGDVWLEEGE